MGEVTESAGGPVAPASGQQPQVTSCERFEALTLARDDGAPARVAEVEKELRMAVESAPPWWQAPDGTRWVKSVGKDEWTGWQPGEDGCWLYTGDEFRAAYPECPDA